MYVSGMVWSCDETEPFFFLLRLVISARSESRLKETQRLCLEHTEFVEIVVGDVSKDGVCKEMVDRAVKKFGGVDVLILNAAFSPSPEWFADMEDPVSHWCVTDFMHL